MAIPQLNSCCCGCTVRTGTKIIGWLSLIGAILSVLRAGLNVSRLYMIEADSKIPEDQKTFISVIRAVTIVLAIFYVFQTIVSVLLLMGAYQNKAHYLLWWIYMSLFVFVITLLGQSVIFFVAYEVDILIGMFFGGVISLYLILVVYSFYREIEHGPGSYA